MIINRIISLCIGFIAGIVAASIWNLNFSYSKWIAVLFIAAGLGYSIFTLYGEYKWREYSKATIYIPLIIAGLALGIFRANSVIYSQSPAILFFNSLQRNELINVRGKIVAEPELRSSHTLNLRIRISQLKKDFEADWKSVPPEDIRVTVTKPRSSSEKWLFNKLSDSRSYGKNIEFTSSYQPVTSAQNPGGFNMKAFLMAEGCIADLKVNNWRLPKPLKGEINDVTPGEGFFLLEWALAAKRSFLRTYRYSIPSPECRLVSGATLGTRFALRGKKYRGAFIEDFFRHSGVGHVLAVSGLHVSVVSLLLYSIFKMSKIPPRYFAPILIFLLFAFTLLTGARPSSLRASIMNSVIILIFVYGGSGFKKATYAGLAISALLILMRRPMVLYSAGFLLSFGAVLSLILISPPVEKILNQLRGAVFAFSLGWYVFVIVFACNLWETFLRWEVIILLLVALWGLICIGSAINRKFPVLLKFRFDRIPSIIRLFLAAQLAIQFGMMIPMSAYFFGNFPIAGMFVNLIAIPLVGVLVQLGILIGLAGMIPYFSWLALIFGAANWVVSYIFIFVAWLGSVVFPYPPVPKPSVRWLVVYYLVILFLLSGQMWFYKLQTFIYSLNLKRPRILKFSLILFCIGIGVPSVYKCVIPSDSNTITVDILSGASNPVVVVTGNREGAVIINSGNSFFASRNVKNLLLARGTISIDSAFCSGRAPDDGAEGFAELADEINIGKIFFPAFPETSDGELRISQEEYAEYFKALGIDTDKKMSYSKKRWFRNCAKAYCELNKIIGDNIEFYESPGKIPLSKKSEILVLSKIYETYPAPLNLKIRDKRFLIVGDPSSKSLSSLSHEELKCDYLIVPIPRSYRLKYYIKGFKKLIAEAKPKEIVICIDSEKFSETRDEIIRDVMDICEDFPIRRTDKENVSYQLIK